MPLSSITNHAATEVVFHKSPSWTCSSTAFSRTNNIYPKQRNVWYSCRSSDDKRMSSFSIWTTTLAVTEICHGLSLKSLSRTCITSGFHQFQNTIIDTIKQYFIHSKPSTMNTVYPGHLRRFDARLLGCLLLVVFVPRYPAGLGDLMCCERAFNRFSTVWTWTR